jgi:alpha-beta hydrolase superfamily lysophospholipase
MPRVQTSDGVELFVRRWPVPESTPRRGSLLLVHGLGEHSGRYEHVAGALTAIGLEVTAYDHRGHGASGGVRGGLPHPDALLDDLALVYGSLGEDAFLLGHSMGGTIAARAVTGGQVTPRALILSSPALALDLSPVQRALAAVGRRLVPDRPMPNRLPLDKLSHDPAVVAAYKADPAVHDRLTARLFDFLADAGESARANASRVTVPTLLLVAGADGLIAARGSREFFERLPDGIGTLHWYDGLYHEIFNEREPDRTRVLGDLRAWLEARL